jgi:hypothetical protein
MASSTKQRRHPGLTSTTTPAKKPSKVKLNIDTPTSPVVTTSTTSGTVDDSKRSSVAATKSAAAAAAAALPPSLLVRSSSGGHHQPSTCRVHRCRFLDWQPSGVRALAFNSDASRLAVARHNGDIEVWHAHTSNGWFCDRVIPGSGEASVQSLMWLPMIAGTPAGTDAHNERLFSVGLNARLIEWNLLKLTPKVPHPPTHIHIHTIHYTRNEMVIK